MVRTRTLAIGCPCACNFGWTPPRMCEFSSDIDISSIYER